MAQINSRNTNAFVTNFMAGFSFVDQIKRQKKADERLEQRLKEMREERAFQRERQIAADQRADALFERGETLFAQSQEDREARLQDEAERDEGARLALDPDTPDEELQRLAPNSPAAAEALRRRLDERKLKAALYEAGNIPRVQYGTGQQSAEQQSAGSEVTQQPSAAPGQVPADAEQAGFRFAPSAGRGGMHQIPEEEFNKYSRAYQDKGFLGKIGDVVAGQASQTVRAAEDVAGAMFNAPGRMRGAITGEDIDPIEQNVGQEFTGTLSMPGEWTTEEEFAEMRASGASSADIQAAAERNYALTAEYEQRGSRPRAMAMDAYSRQGAALQASDESRRAAIVAERQAVKSAQDFLNPATSAESQLGQLAVKDPKAAAVLYFETRATLQDANPQLATEMDAAMMPVLEEAGKNFTAEVQAMDINSPQGRRALASLSNLHHSMDRISRSQPSVNQVAGINSQGVRVGDQQRVNDVVDVMFDPTRPSPTQSTNAQVNAAITVAGRITPDRRLNDRQVDALATLAQAGYVDKQTALSIMMTGYWPPGKDPNAIRDIKEAGGTVWAITEGGNHYILQGGKSKIDDMPVRELGEDQFKWVGEGIRSVFPNMEANNIHQLQNIMYTDPAWIRSRFNVTSQEDMRKLGAMLAESKILAGKKYAELQDGPLWFKGNTKDAPTINQIMMDPELRDRLANEFDMTYTPMPELKDLDGLDEEGIRQAMREGRLGPTAYENADKYTSEQVLMLYGRWRTMELDAAGRLDVDRSGNVTILPEPRQ